MGVGPGWSLARRRVGVTVVSARGCPSGWHSRGTDCDGDTWGQGTSGSTRVCALSFGDEPHKLLLLWGHTVGVCARGTEGWHLGNVLGLKVQES